MSFHEDEEAASGLHRRPGAVARRRTGAGRLEYVTVIIAIAVIAIHLVDDSFIHPEAGTSAGDHVVSGIVPVATLGVAVLIYPRVRPGLRATIALVVGSFGIVAWAEGW